MSSLEWAPPRPAPSTRSTALASPSASSPPPPPPPHDSSPLSTPSGELALLRALVHHRLVGPTKHWDMVGVLVHLRSYPHLSPRDVWDKYAQLYDHDTLEQVWLEQQQQALPSPQGTPEPGRDSPPSSSSSSASSTTKEQHRVLSTFFPTREFSLSPSSFPLSSTPGAPANTPEVDLSPLLLAAFERGALPPGAPRESPVPDDAPLREVSVPLAGAGAGASAGGSPARKRAPGGAGASPRKRARGAAAAHEDAAASASAATAAAAAGAEGDESELSELSDADEEEGEDGEGEGSEGEGREGDEGEEGDEEEEDEDEGDEDDVAGEGSGGDEDADGAGEGRRGASPCGSSLSLSFA